MGRTCRERENGAYEMTALETVPEEGTLCLDYVTEVGHRIRAPHRNTHYELIVVERGIVQIEVEGHFALLAARDAALLPPNRSYRAGSGIAPALWIARFDACEVDIGLPLAGARVYRLAAERREAVFAVLRLLSVTAADQSAYRRLVRRLHFTALVATVFESTDVREFVPALSNALVRAALEIIDRRYAEYIGPAEIASELRRHPAYLTSLVRETTGKSLGTWLIERRLAAARALLSKTDDSIGDIAAAVGYVDVSHFARYFTRHYGIPPARWRRSRSA
jgi:AraC-like DNA-binding protein